MTPSPELQFIGEIGDRNFSAVIDLVTAYPELADTGTPVGTRCFIKALEYGNGAVIKCMLQHGATLRLDPKLVPNGEVPSALHLAVVYTNVAALEVLLKHPGCDINAVSDGGETALNYGTIMLLGGALSSREHTNKIRECIDMLLARGADVNIIPIGDYPLLPNLCWRENTGTALDIQHFRIIARATDDIEYRGPERNLEPGMTPFLLAMPRLPWAFIKELIQAGADAQAQDARRRNALNLQPAVTDLRNYANNKKFLRDLSKRSREVMQDIAALTPDRMLHALTSELGNRPNNALMTGLSLSTADVLTDPAHWRQKPGGIEAGLAFAHQLLELLPDNRPHLQAKVNMAGLQRESDTPREDSVLVDYARGGTNDRGVT